MSEMVERVARASFAAWAKNRDNGKVFEDMTDSEREWCMEHAREMIKALRGPVTDAMYMRGQAFMQTGHPDQVWNAMLNEALK